jgi:hypothetical protein
LTWIDIRTPEISKNAKESNVLEECSGDAWNADEGAIGEDAEMVIDMKCPHKLQEVQVINGVGDFSTRGFSVLGSTNSTGPWKKIYIGELEKRMDEVWWFYKFHDSLKFILNQNLCCPLDVNGTETKQNSSNCSLSIFPMPAETIIYLEKLRFFKFQVESFYGKGGGLNFLRLNGTRLGLLKLYL